MRSIRKQRPTEDDNFAVNSMETLLSAYNNVMGVVFAIGLVITGISLFVGGIGVMNIMFVSVTERTREIGIRKSIGAKRRSILSQFLYESSIICMIGGLIGVVISFGIAALINAFVMPASISINIVLIALLVSILTGVISGFIPALRASRLNPIDALAFD
jgi:putative ABC transport system permease protein